MGLGMEGQGLGGGKGWALAVWADVGCCGWVARPCVRVRAEKKQDISYTRVRVAWIMICECA